MKLLMITFMAVCAAVNADPAVIFSGGYLGSPLSSAALIAPATPMASVQPVAPVAAVGSVSSLAPVVPVAPVTSYLSDYRYAYGSGYTYQDAYPVVNSALTLPYSLPYAYAADWYYRK